MRLQPAKCLFKCLLMKPRAFFLPLLLLLAAIPGAHASSPKASPTPGLMDKTLEFLHLKHAPRPRDTGEIHDGMELKLSFDPMPIKLSVIREEKVTLDVYNDTKQFIHLNFPTSQRVEILLRDPTGKVVTTWSEDQSFTDDPATVTINPWERIEYSEELPTREMSPGQRYTIVVSIPSYPDLTISQPVIPQQ
jgi:hypothetical protein